MSKITIEFEGIDTKDVESVDISFRDGRPTMTKTTTRPDDAGKLITTTTIMPYEPEKETRKPFGRRPDHDRKD